MTEHGYEKGRLNLPFVGLCTFAKQPACLDWDRIDADWLPWDGCRQGRQEDLPAIAGTVTLYQRSSMLTHFMGANRRDRARGSNAA